MTHLTIQYDERKNYETLNLIIRRKNTFFFKKSLKTVLPSFKLFRGLKMA